MSEPDDRRKNWHDRFQSASFNNMVQALAIIAAGLWAIYTFVYQQEIQPSMEPAALTVSSTLEKAGQRGSLTAIRSTITRTNVGRTAVRLLGFTYNVTGIREDFGDGNGVNPAFGHLPENSSSVRLARYYGSPQKREVIVRGGILFEGATSLSTSSAELNPGESVSRDVIFYVDHTRFDSIRFKVRLVYQKTEDAPIPLDFSIDGEDQLLADVNRACEEAQDGCQDLNGTDFTTELSLW